MNKPGCGAILGLLVLGLALLGGSAYALQASRHASAVSQRSARVDAKVLPEGGLPAAARTTQR